MKLCCPLSSVCLFTSGRPCHPSSFKHYSEDIIFLWEDSIGRSEGVAGKGVDNIHKRAWIRTEPGPQQRNQPRYVGHMLYQVSYRVPLNFLSLVFFLLNGKKKQTLDTDMGTEPQTFSSPTQEIWQNLELDQETKNRNYLPPSEQTHTE